MEEKEKEITLKGPQALQLAHQLSKLPAGDFHIVFFPLSRAREDASPRLRTILHCKWRTQLPNEAFDISPENFFLFTDHAGNPKKCYRYLIRFLAFPTDGYVMHPITWLN